MVKNIYKTLLVALVLLLISSVSFADKDFSVTSNQATIQSQVNEPVQFQVNIDNTGDEPINLTINDLVLSDGTNSLSFDANNSELLNFNTTESSKSIVFDNGSLLNEVGIYTGNLIVEDSQNVSFTKNVSFELNIVDGRSLENPSISIPSSIAQGDIVTFSLTLQNNGSVDIDDAQILFEIPNIGVSESKNVSTVIQGGSQVTTFEVTIPESATSQTTDVNVNVGYADDSKQVSATESFFILPDESVFFQGFESGEISFMIDLDRDTDRKRLTLVNDLDETITDLVFTLERDIGDFEIRRHIEFEDSRDERLDVNNEERNDVELRSNGGSYSFRFGFDRLNEIELREHFGSNVLRVEYRIEGQSGIFSETFDMRIETEKDDFDIGFVQREYELRVERNSNEDIDLEIDNDEDFDVEDISIRIGDDFELTTDSSKKLSSSRFEFGVLNPFTLREGRDEVELTIEADDNDRIGTYEGTIILERDRNEIDEVRVKVRITDGISILSVTPQSDARPDENLRVDVVIENTKGLTEVDVRGEFRNINSRGLDVTDSETTLLPSRDQKTIRLNFDIPSDVRDGDLLLDLFVEYDDPENRDERVEFRDRYTIPVDRQSVDFQIRTAFVSPQVISCENEVDTRMTIRNIGVTKGDVDLTASVQGSPGLATTRSYSIEDNEERTFISALDVSSLDPGRYDVEFLVEFEDDERSRITSFTVEECESDNNGGGTTDPTPIPTPNNETGTGGDNGNGGDDTSENVILDLFSNPTVILSIIAFTLLIIVIIVAALVL